MAAVFPRLRGTVRPFYLPTAIQARQANENLPSPILSPLERQRLVAKGISADRLDALTPPVVRVNMRLPADTIPARIPKIYNPSEHQQRKQPRG
jgi:hypothetical protein